MQSKPKHEILIKSEKILEKSFVMTQRQLLAVQIHVIHWDISVSLFEFTSNSSTFFNHLNPP